MREPLMTVEDMAEVLRCTPRAVYNRVHRREIPHVKVGARVYFERAAIDAWIGGGVAEEPKLTGARRVSPRSGPRRPQLAIRIDADIIERLDRAAIVTMRALGHTRSECARRLLTSALEQLERELGRPGGTLYYVPTIGGARIQYHTENEARAAIPPGTRFTRHTEYRDATGEMKHVDIEMV